ncbi:hypothetical protein N4P33_29310 [Streptomyces sp. 15-116A]|uniref:hypothetical protein n=1 Tax=Streptomyces sp. 15-116A TaxID=2259035 RepID=UPI0021B29259|nr:hypothetical protein [Streptomyces sp. 15-116A]MCT7356215.1 hypothetical protein [Streptomyces sp. 15-116A]
MRKYQKAAVVMAMLGSVGFIGAGVSHAGDDPQVELNNKQSQSCEQNDSATGLINIDDINVSLGILGLSQQDNSEKSSVACATSFTVGGEDE